MSSPIPAPSRSESRNSGRRSTSLGFLRRSKSNDLLGERKASNKLTRRKQKELEEENERNKQTAGKIPPKLPGLSPQAQLQPFGEMSKDARPMNGVPPVPPIPTKGDNQSFDPYARTESMTHRGRYSYANSTVSTLNSPRRVRRRKDPTPYNVLILGAKGSGKTSFLNFLKKSLELPPKKQAHRDQSGETPPPSSRNNRSFVHHYQEVEIDNERIGLTLWDSQGLDKSVVDLQLREMSNFVESKFEDTFIEEMKVVRAPGVRDTHIHCAFFILDPARLDSNVQASQQNSNGAGPSKFNKHTKMVGVLDDDFDLQVLRTLQGKTTVVPVISKADTITTAHMSFLKKTVCESLKKAGLDPLEALNYGGEDDDPNDFDKLDERDEDEARHREIQKKVDNSSDDESAQSEDSDTLPEDAPKLKRQTSVKRHSANLTSSSSMNDSGYVPLSILSPDSYSFAIPGERLGRKFPWGFADPYDPEHCDFVKLQEACFGDWRADLREASREVFYERWRTSRLNHKGVVGTGAGTGAGPGTGAGVARATPEPRKVSGGPGGIPQGILKGRNR